MRPKAPLRSLLLREAMRPAETTDEWRKLKSETIPIEALQGLTRASFAHPQEEAQAIALMLRQALIKPETNRSTCDAGPRTLPNASRRFSRAGISKPTIPPVHRSPSSLLAVTSPPFSPQHRRMRAQSPGSLS